MKANHNYKITSPSGKIVVVNISSSKNESKSQLIPAKLAICVSCCKYQ
ncbi:hypothetical protein SAMN05421813_1135 [Daejeonella rubra]|uniref:Uncharacterized protein n=1 Tax=Daejeonella rubra TaxID=990371 RepID=A0A1G9TFT1_9SPHI|nr:hypothetical protein SAMN05421813_1135 [Daejeonella rubra]